MHVRALLTSALLTGVFGHGRLTIPATRFPVGYENDPVSGPDGTDFVCRNDPTNLSGSNSNTNIVAGGELSLRWDLSVNHEGDCAVYIGYGDAISSGVGDEKRAGEFVKLANVFSCWEYNHEDYVIDLPDWLPSGPAVIRWEWYAIHVWPTIEFYSQCADVIVESNSKLTPEQLPSYPVVGPQLFPSDANDAPGFRCSPTRCIGSDQFQTGPPCAFENEASERNNCGNTSEDTLGYLDPEADERPLVTPRPTTTDEQFVTQAPTVAVTPNPSTPTPRPTPRPTTSEETGECSNAAWAACGGISFANSPTCCPAGNTCYENTEWYSQCRPNGDCPDDWDCNSDNGNTTRRPTPRPTPQPTEQGGNPVPQPTQRPTEQPTPRPTTEGGNCDNGFDADVSVLNVVGYYGNSGGQGCPNGSCIPAISDIPAEYNVLVLNFINFANDGSIEFLVGGPQSKSELPQAIETWKQAQDPWNRPRHALVSIGGQNGHWSNNGVDAETVFDVLVAFLEEYNLDGLDVDLEGAALSGAGTLTQVVQMLRDECYLVGAAPEAAQGPLDAYKPLLKHLSWVHPQFYNNGPNAVTTPWTGNIGWNPTNTWQDTCAVCPAKEPFWFSILENIGAVGQLESSQLGMLVPATTLAAGNNNIWDYAMLAHNVGRLGIRHVGTWAIGHDATANYQFAKSFTTVLDARLQLNGETKPSMRPLCEEIKARDSCDRNCLYAFGTADLFPLIPDDLVQSVCAGENGRYTVLCPSECPETNDVVTFSPTRHPTFVPTLRPTNSPTESVTSSIPESFSGLGEFKVWCARSDNKESCKRCLGKFKEKNGSTRCQPPKRTNKVKCKKLKNAELCKAVGCSVKKKNGKCQGKAFTKKN